MKKLLLLLLLPFTTLAQKQVIVHLTTDGYPLETRWVLHADSAYGNILGDVNYGYYTQGNTSYTDTLYISDSLTNISFVIYDSYGDGIMSPGSYFVSICADTIISYPNPSFTTGLISNRVIPPCNGPPPASSCVPTIVNINLDQFQSETTWEIHDSTGSLLYAGGPYSQAPDYQPQFEPVCLPTGNITFTIYDSYGDGLAGALWGGSDGSYYVIQCGDTLVYGNVPDFGTDSTHVFTSDTCVPPPPIPGCMDEDYLEFDPAATADDSSCATLKILGCTDSTMFNYDLTANTMDYIDSCDYTLTLHDLVGNGWVGSRLEIYQDDTTQFVMTSGSSQTFTIQLNAPALVQAKFFINAQASNTTLECGFTLTNPMGDTVISVVPPFMQAFNVYSGTTYCGNECIEIVEGCVDSLAYNYDSLANTSSLCYYVPGCMSPAYLTYYTQGFVADIDNGSCDTLALFGCTDNTAFNYDITANVDNGGCVPVIVGCMQALAFNYNPQANTPGYCVATIYGCMSSIALNYNPSANVDDGSCIAIVYGCTNSNAFNYNPSANVNDGSCIAIVYGCMDATMFNYEPLANTDNGSCIPFMYGCMDSTAFNYDPLANADNNSCIEVVYGCTNPAALNYNPLANVDDLSCEATIYGCTDSLAFNYSSLANFDNGSCLPIILGCIDPSALNYCDSCNTDDFSCVLPIYGCMDSTMFNYNSLANVDNGSCISVVYGCTDPSMLNFNSQANTEDFSCITYMYGCMDSTALNYDSLANTDNGSCIEVVAGCMDQTANNYNPLANVDANHCHYDAGCITGPGDPYWLNDPCYAWVISVDDYCCENEWDNICQLTYDYCDSTFVGPVPSRKSLDEIIVYPNPTKDKININKFVDIRVYNIIGDMIISENNINVLDVSILSPGVYNLQIMCDNKIVNKKIIKE